MMTSMGNIAKFAKMHSLFGQTAVDANHFLKVSEQQSVIIRIAYARDVPTINLQLIVVYSLPSTTVYLMTAYQTFRFVSILPGLRLSAFAMHDYTARLPFLSVDDEPAGLPVVPGRNTEDAMRAGLFIGQLGAVRELVDRLSSAAMNRFEEKEPPVIVVTGGGGRQLTQNLSGAVFIDSLALHGLAMLAQICTLSG